MHLAAGAFTRSIYTYLHGLHGLHAHAFRLKLPMHILIKKHFQFLMVDAHRRACARVCLVSFVIFWWVDQEAPKKKVMDVNPIFWFGGP